MASKPGAVRYPGISLEETCLLSRWRDLTPGAGAERGNLSPRCEGRNPSGQPPMRVRVPIRGTGAEHLVQQKFVEAHTLFRRVSCKVIKAPRRARSCSMTPLEAETPHEATSRIRVSSRRFNNGCLVRVGVCWRQGWAISLPLTGIPAPKTQPVTSWRDGSELPPKAPAPGPSVLQTGRERR